MRLAILFLGLAACASTQKAVFHHNPVVLVEYFGQRPLTDEERASGKHGPLPPWLKELREASGSGFFVNDRGDIVTNHHVVVQEGVATTQVVVTVDGKWMYPARVVHAEKGADLAVLRIDLIEGTHVPVLPLGDLEPEEGDAVFALGYPGGGPFREQSGAVTRRGALVECTIPVRVGNSGGPVLDEGRHVVGVVTGLRTRTWKSPGASLATEHCLVVPLATLRGRLDEWKVAYR